MGKGYSIEEIKQALELLEIARSGKNIFDGFLRMMQFNAGIHKIDVGSEQYQSIRAAERLQELVRAGRRLVIENIITDDGRKIAIFVQRERGKVADTGKGDSVLEAILNIKIEEGESNG